MVAVLEQETAPATIEATVNYIVDNGEKIFTLDRRRRAPPTCAPAARTTRGASHPQRRLDGDDFALERDGFRFVPHDTKVARLLRRGRNRRVYYPEMEALVKAESGAARVVVFDHTLRTADDELREARKIREVVRRVHNDYTEWSGPQRVRDLLPR